MRKRKKKTIKKSKQKYFSVESIDGINENFYFKN